MWAGWLREEVLLGVPHLMRLFRERLLGSLLDKRAISQELVRKLLAWRHPGFSAHVGEPIAAEDCLGSA